MKPDPILEDLKGKLTEADLNLLSLLNAVRGTTRKVFYMIYDSKQAPVASVDELMRQIQARSPDDLTRIAVTLCEAHLLPALKEFAGRVQKGKENVQSLITDDPAFLKLIT